ncbi:hypothetical protein ACXR0O_27850 [Verrucomicrobiota bacterium sgz303538]
MRPKTNVLGALELKKLLPPWMASRAAREYVQGTNACPALSRLTDRIDDDTRPDYPMLSDSQDLSVEPLPVLDGIQHRCNLLPDQHVSRRYWRLRCKQTPPMLSSVSKK